MRDGEKAETELKDGAKAEWEHKRKEGSEETEAALCSALLRRAFD